MVTQKLSRSGTVLRGRWQQAWSVLAWICCCSAFQSSWAEELLLHCRRAETFYGYARLSRHNGKIEFSGHHALNRDADLVRYLAHELGMEERVKSVKIRLPEKDCVRRKHWGLQLVQCRSQHAEIVFATDQGERTERAIDLHFEVRKRALTQAAGKISYIDFGVWLFGRSQFVFPKGELVDSYAVGDPIAKCD